MAKTAPTVGINDIEDLFNRYSKHAEFIGEEIIDVTQPGLFGSQILHLAAFSNRVEDVALSIAGGADINAIGDLGLSPLHYAVLGGSAEVAQFLIAHGTDLTLENEFQETPRQMADLIGESNVAAVLAAADHSPTHMADDSESARSRWLDFKSIQTGNFWSDE
jgi:uncharacterized protein